MLRIGSIVLRVDDLRRQTEFSGPPAHDYVRRDVASDDLRPPDADYVILADPKANASASWISAGGGRWLSVTWPLRNLHPGYGIRRVIESVGPGNWRTKP